MEKLSPRDSKLKAFKEELSISGISEFREYLKSEYSALSRELRLCDEKSLKYIQGKVDFIVFMLSHVCEYDIDKI